MKIRELLDGTGRNVLNAQLALFSREGFDENLAAEAVVRNDVHLIDLTQLYVPG